MNLTGLICRKYKIFYFCRRVSPVRPAPAEFPQGRKAARVGGCSGATQVAYPLFFERKKSGKFEKKFCRLKNKFLTLRGCFEKANVLKVLKRKAGYNKRFEIKAELAQLVRARSADWRIGVLSQGIKRQSKFEILN